MSHIATRRTAGVRERERERESERLEGGFESECTMSFISWVVRVIAVLWFVYIASRYIPSLSYLFRKMRLYMSGVLSMLIGTDKKFKSTLKRLADPDAIAAHADQLATRRVMFIRHGESEWNLVFNRGMNFGLLGRLVAAIMKELSVSLRDDSVFLDSPLSQLGEQQAKQLLAYVESYEGSGDGKDARVKECVEILKGEAEVSAAATGKTGANFPSSSGRGGRGGVVLWTSNLRRSIATVVIGLWGRLSRNTGEKVHVQSFLQEISTNVDTLALAEALEVPEMDLSRPLGLTHASNKMGSSGGFSMQKYLDPRGNRGNKPIFGSGLTRLQRFCAAAFRTDCSTIIASGHSLWFKHFFAAYLPRSSTHVSKSRKMKNGAVVSFVLAKGVGSDGKPLYRIDPASVVEVYKGFE